MTWPGAATSAAAAARRDRGRSLGRHGTGRNAAGAVPAGPAHGVLARAGRRLRGRGARDAAGEPVHRRLGGLASARGAQLPRDLSRLAALDRPLPGAGGRHGRALFRRPAALPRGGLGGGGGPRHPHLRAGVRVSAPRLADAGAGRDGGLFAFPGRPGGDPAAGRVPARDAGDEGALRPQLLRGGQGRGAVQPRQHAVLLALSVLPHGQAVPPAAGLSQLAAATDARNAAGARGGGGGQGLRGGALALPPGGAAAGAGLPDPRQLPL